MLLCLITKDGESLSFRIEKTRALELRTSIVGCSAPCDQSQARQRISMCERRREWSELDLSEGGFSLVNGSLCSSPEPGSQG